MTLTEAIEVIKDSQESISSRRRKGHAVYPTKELAAAFELLPYAVEHQKWRWELAGRAMQALASAHNDEGSWTGDDSTLTADVAVEIADALIDKLQQNEEITSTEEAQDEEDRLEILEDRIKRARKYARNGLTYSAARGVLEEILRGDIDGEETE
jgi:hypothetical protein